MTLIQKIIAYATVILVIAGVGFVIYRQEKILSEQKTIESTVVLQKDLIDNIQRSMAQYSTRADLEKFINDNGQNLDAIQKDLNKLAAKVVADNQITVISTGQTTTNIPSTNTTPTTNPTSTASIADDPNGYYKNTQSLDLHENFGDVKVPIGEVEFDASNKKPWSVDILSRSYSVNTVIGVDDSERLYPYNQVAITVDGKKYDVKIANSQIVQQLPTATFSWWNPRVAIGLGTGISTGTGSGQLNGAAEISLLASPFSYGRLKTKPSWLFLQLGPSLNVVNKKFGILINPAAYNLNGVITFLKNTYVAPGVSIDTTGNISVIGSATVSF